MALILWPDLFILFRNCKEKCGSKQMLGRRLPKSRRFSYTPYYYDPEKEEKEKRQIKFKRRSSRASIRARSIFWLLFLLVLVIYLIISFVRMSNQ
jgi:hypothetical protein